MKRKPRGRQTRLKTKLPDLEHAKVAVIVPFLEVGASME